MFTSPFGNIMQGITVVEWKQRQNLRAKIHLFCSLHWLKNCKRYASTLIIFCITSSSQTPSHIIQDVNGHKNIALAHELPLLV